MKGIVFTEFIEMVEDHFSPEVADRMIVGSGVGGAYTAVGTYDHREMVCMVQCLSQDTGQPVPALLSTFGEHLAGRFAGLFPQFFAEQPDLFSFLASIDDHIHVEVRKLYPDAELPRFAVLERTDDTLTLRYESSRHLSDLAAGLIHGAARHYGVEVQMRRETTADGGIIFGIRRTAHAGAH